MSPREACLSRFQYNPSSGLFTCNPNLVFVGKQGRIHLDYFGKKEPAASVAWYIMMGKFPEKDMVIDHIDWNPANNKWVNLRKVTKRENVINRRDGKHHRRFLANVNFDNQSYFLGWFNTEEERDKVRDEAYERVKNGTLSMQSILSDILA